MPLSRFYRSESARNTTKHRTTAISALLILFITASILLLFSKSNQIAYDLGYQLGANETNTHWITGFYHQD